MFAHAVEEPFNFTHLVVSSVLCGTTVFLRNKIRVKKQIPGSVLEDFLLSVCCSCCSFVQVMSEYKEDGCDFWPLDL
jgi:Cys-rich protein (TIGR01571 family)